jgi:hypothetical protein
MTHDWILDVLRDLRSFARHNDMHRLAEQLDDTALVAMAEMRRATSGHRSGGRVDVRIGDAAGSGEGL